MKQNRRQFLQQTSAIAASGWLGALSAIQEASAAGAVSDYKALVCVFLYGGMDHVHTLPPSPRDTQLVGSKTAYDSYKSERLNIQHSAESLTMDLGRATEANGKASALYAITPRMPKLKALFDNKRAAVLMNVGPLLEPTARRAGAGYAIGDAPVYFNPITGAPTKQPLRVGSHNDQQQTWQTLGVEGSTVGWAGLMSDQLRKRYTGDPTFNAIGVGEAPPLVSGVSTTPLQISTTDALSRPWNLDPLRIPVYGSSAVTTAAAAIFSGLGTSARSMSYLEQNIVGIHKRSINADNALRAVRLPDAEIDPLTNTSGDLATQLRNVARMIRHAKEKAGTAGLTGRQVFFVSLGGWDNHSALVNATNVLHPQLDNAISAFHESMKLLGMDGNVTLFTASDFGRTLSGNGDGTDHGWGGHHFIVGGGVRGGVIYGAPLSHNQTEPNTVRYGDKTPIYEHISRGVAIPSTSVHQYAATLAKWMGVTDNEMPQVIKSITKYPVAPANSAEAAWPRYLNFIA